MAKRISNFSKNKIVNLLGVQYPEIDRELFRVVVDFTNMYYVEVKKNKYLKKTDPAQSSLFEPKQLVIPMEV